MSTEAQELLEKLVEKISKLEENLNKIVLERDELTHMIKSMYIWQKGLSDKLRKYEKTHREADSQSKEDVERETTGVRKETSR